MRKVPRRIAGAKLQGFRGIASDPGGPGLRKVQVALLRVRPGHRVVKPKRWRKARGTAKWRFKLRRPLRPGSYVVFSRAVDRDGLAEKGFSRRDRNRYKFTVPAP